MVQPNDIFGYHPSMYNISREEHSAADPMWMGSHAGTRMRACSEQAQAERAPLRDPAGHARVGVAVGDVGQQGVRRDRQSGPPGEEGLEQAQVVALHGGLLAVRARHLPRHMRALHSE